MTFWWWFILYMYDFGHFG